MRILLLCSAFNGLTQRVWIDLRADGHTVHVVTTTSDATSDAAVRHAAESADPDLILCPYLRERVPEDVWRRYRTVVIHPGPEGDRGPSSLDWAISEGAREWGVTAVSAVEEMDAGPVWGTRTFAIPEGPVRKSALYGGPVTAAAADLAREVVAKAADPAFTPRPAAPDAAGRLRPLMRQADRAFSWDDPAEHVLRRIRAGDGSPGVRTELAGTAVSVFDAHPGPAAGPGAPGSVAEHRRGSVLVRTGEGTLWIGRLRPVTASSAVPRVKLPATWVLGDRLDGVPDTSGRLPVSPPGAARDITYRRRDRLGILRVDVHNGALSASQCQRLTAALRYAVRQDTRALLLTGGEYFSNGIHLNTIEASPDPAAEAWRTIQAIDDACREIITCTHQLVVAALGGNAGAGGVMLGLGADVVLVREGTVLNPHYRSMGLTGSEYWTYTLPRRVGAAEAARLTGECLPIGHDEAVGTGLADEALPGGRAEFDAAAEEYTARLVRGGGLALQLAAKQASRDLDEDRRPLETYRIRELAEMSRDIFDDRYGFAARRHAFVTKTRCAAGAERGTAELAAAS